MIDNKPSVCIVGSGPGGAIAAIELARSGKFRVILVDLNKISDANGETNEISELISTCNVGAPFVQNVTRGLGFGGGSQLWHGVLTKLDEEDWGLLDSRLNNNLSSEVKIYYEKIEKYFGKLPYRWADKLKKKITANQGIFGLLEGSGNFIGKDFFIQKNPLRLRKHLQNARDQGLPIQFIENAVAIRINSKMGVDSTVESLLVDVQGEKKIIFADYFILSSGALETPRIMLQSIYEKSLHIKNKNIGKYLTDHPWTILGTIASKKGSFRIGLTDVLLPGKNKYRLGYRLLVDKNTIKIGENHCVAIKPLFIGEYVEFKEALKTVLFQKNSLANILSTIERFGIVNVLASALMLLNEKFGFGAYVKRALVFCYLEQPERSDSCVTISSVVDSRGRMIPKVNWVIDTEEFEAVNTITDHFKKLFSNSEAFSFSPSESSIKDLSSGSHHAGTMRIANDESSGVIDSNLRVFGLNNLFICDLSIFPNYGNSNPTYTLAAFSVRLANYLISKHSHR